MVKKLSQSQKKQMLFRFKGQGVPREDVEKAFRNVSLVPPSVPTIRKYYNMSEEEKKGAAGRTRTRRAWCSTVSRTSRSCGRRWRRTPRRR